MDKRHTAEAKLFLRPHVGVSSIGGSSISPLSVGVKVTNFETSAEIYSVALPSPTNYKEYVITTFGYITEPTTKNCYT